MTELAWNDIVFVRGKRQIHLFFGHTIHSTENQVEIKQDPDQAWFEHYRLSTSAPSCTTLQYLNTIQKSTNNQLTDKQTLDMNTHKKEFVAKHFMRQKGIQTI